MTGVPESNLGLSDRRAEDGGLTGRGLGKGGREKRVGACGVQEQAWPVWGTPLPRAKHVLSKSGKRLLFDMERTS